MERFHGWVAVAAALVAAAAGGPALCQVARSGGSGNAELLQQMQQLAADRTRLQAENERLANELAGVKKDRDALKAGQQGLDRRARDDAAALARINSQHEATEQELSQYKAKMQELIGKFRETIQKLRETETDGAAARQSLAERDRELGVCVNRNVALYHLNDEVLTRLEKKRGLLSWAAQEEPFTRIKRVQLENLIDDYRARARDQLVQPGGPPPATPSAQPVTH